MHGALLFYLGMQILFSIGGLIVGVYTAGEQASARESLKAFLAVFIVFSFLYIVLPAILLVELIKFFVRVWRDE